MSEQPEQTPDSPEQPAESHGDSHSDPKHREAAAVYNREMADEGRRHEQRLHDANEAHAEAVHAIQNRYTAALSATEQA